MTSLNQDQPVVSSQEFRNIYEKLYACMRNYLWSYDVLKQFAEVEFDIYSAFIDGPKLIQDLKKLQALIKDVYNEDLYIAKHFAAMLDLLNKKDATTYLRLPQVAEVNPLEIKTLRTIPEKGDQ